MNNQFIIAVIFLYSLALYAGDENFDSKPLTSKEARAIELYAHDNHHHPSTKPKKKGNGVCQQFPNLHTQTMSYQDACKYSATCPSEKYANKRMMYCSKENIPACNASKAWVSINKLLNISDKTAVAGTSRQYSVVEGKGSHRICARLD